MEKNSLLEVFVDERMFTILETALDKNTDYQEAIKAERKALKKLEKTNLNDRQKHLISRVIDTSNHSNSIYGTIAYKQGLQDGMKLIYADEIPSYPYEKNNFMLDVIHKDDVFMIQILLPAYNPNTDDILRTYLIFDKHNNDISLKKYFVIKIFFQRTNFYYIHIPSIKGTCPRRTHHV